MWLKNTKLPKREDVYMNILTQDTYDEKSIITSISSFCKEYSVGKILKKANAYKSKGIPLCVRLVVI